MPAAFAHLIRLRCAASGAYYTLQSLSQWWFIAPERTQDQDLWSKISGGCLVAILMDLLRSGNAEYGRGIKEPPKGSGSFLIAVYPFQA